MAQPTVVKAYRTGALRDLEGRGAGEVLVEIKAAGICHTDIHTLDGLDSEGLFPSVLGHEGARIVREAARA